MSEHVIDPDWARALMLLTGISEGAAHARVSRISRDPELLAAVRQVSAELGGKGTAVDAYRENGNIVVSTAPAVPNVGADDRLKPKDKLAEMIANGQQRARAEMRSLITKRELHSVYGYPRSSIGWGVL